MNGWRSSVPEDVKVLKLTGSVSKLPFGVLKEAAVELLMRLILRTSGKCDPSLP